MPKKVTPAENTVNREYKSSIFAMLFRDKTKLHNGEEECPDRDVLKLSDLYYEKEEDPSLELKAIALNINQGHNPELMETCQTLREYAEYTDRVRRYAKEMLLEEAVERAITECIREGILEDFLKKNRAEAMKVSIYEYDAQKHIEMEREDSYQDGYQAGKDDGYQAGKDDGYRQIIRTMLSNGRTVAQISAELEIEEDRVIELAGKSED